MIIRRAVMFACLFVVLLIIYSNTFSVPFIFDDIDNISQNIFLFQRSSFFDIWHGDFLTEWSRLRIFGYLSFFLNYYFGGLDVFGYHVVNFFIHFLNGIFVFFLAGKVQKIFLRQSERKGDAVSFFAAAIFLFHPLQTQAVTYVVQRFTSLAAFFYLSAFLSYLNFRLNSPSKRRKALFFSLFLMLSVLGCLTKENAFSIVFMILSFEWIFSCHSDLDQGTASMRSKRILLWMVFVIIFSIVLASYLHIFDRMMTPYACSSDEGKMVTGWTYFLTQPRVILRYMMLLIFPVHQNFDYEFRLSETIFDLETFLSFILISLVLSGAVCFRKKQPVFSFLIFWFFISLSIESSVIPLQDLIFEHRVYLPMFGFALAVPIFLLKKAKLDRIGIFFLIVWLCFFSFLTFRRNYIWSNPVLLWQDVVLKSPHKSRARHNLAQALYESGQKQEAKDEYHKALALNGCNLFTHNNLGLIYLEEGLGDRAKEYFQKDIDCFPLQSFAAYNNLGLIYRDDGRDEEAVFHFEKALAINPYWVEPYINLGDFYTTKGDLFKAKQYFHTAIEKFPHNVCVLEKLVQTCLADKDIACVEEALTARMSRKGNVVRYLEIIALIALDGNFKTAQKYYEQAVTFFPKNPQPYIEYGKFLANYNLFDMAIFIWEKAGAVFPDNKEFSELIHKAKTLKDVQSRK